MPSLVHGIGHGIGPFTGEAQEPEPWLKADHLGSINQLELIKSPRLTNFFNLVTTNEVKQEQQQQQQHHLATPLHMVGLLQTAQILHDMEAQVHCSSLNKVDMALWNKASTLKVETSSHDHDDSKTWKIGRSDRKQQLGMLLSIPISRADHNSSAAQLASARKRSASSMLESEPELLNPELRLQSRSNTSSESTQLTGTGPAAAAGGKPVKIQKTETFAAAGAGIDKDLLSLSLPVSNSSTTNSESSSSSQENLHDDVQSPSKLGRFRSSKVYPSSGNDGAESNMLDHMVTIASLTCRADSADGAAEDTVGTHSSSGPMSPETHRGNQDHETDFQLTLQLDSLKAPVSDTKILEGSTRSRSKFQPLTCTGLDAEALNQQSLLLRDLDTGLEAHGLQLVHLLLKCADATAQRNVKSAARILGELYQGASLYGDSMQRVAAYFAEGLAARIVSKESPMYSNLMVQPSTEQYCSAFTTLYKVAPYFQFAHFTANQAILEAVEGHQFVHVVDLDIMQGFQWPCLIQALAARKGGPPQLRITGVGKHANVVRETGRRLTSFAASFGVPFEFQSVIEEQLENLTPEMLAPRFGEVLAVNSVLQLHRLLNPTSGENLHRFMHSLCRRLKPAVVTVVEQEANHNAPSFLGRFMEALHYYAAVFDSLDASLPQQSEERVKVEQLFFAQQIKNIVVSDGNERVERHETFDLWQQRMEMAGFYQVPLSAHAVSQAKLLLQFSPCEGYRLHEREGSICLGWQERLLLTASAWSC
ncbi:unnamed protein product [Calypogeia fissa]